MLKIGKIFKDDQAPSSDKIINEKGTSPTTSPISKEEKTIIGEHISIEGNIRGEENLIIEGSMKGKLEMEKHNFTVGSKGRVEGEIHAQNVSISGQLKGNIKALGKVEITKEADFYGEIKGKSISVEDGAYFKGVIELDREPHRKPAFEGKPTDQALNGHHKKPIAQLAEVNKEK